MMHAGEQRNIQIVHGAFMAAPLIYVGVVMLLEVQGTRAQASDPASVQLVAGILSVVYVLSLVLCPLVTRVSVKQAVSQGLPPGAVFKKAHLLAIAFYESGAIYGLVIAFMGGPLYVFFGFVAVCEMLLLRSFPTARKLQELG